MIAIIMWGVLCAFLIYSMNNPQASFFWGNHITYILYAAYLVTMVILFIAPFENKKDSTVIKENTLKDRDGDFLHIEVSRDSVCMADDAFEHTKIFAFDKADITYEELFHALKEGGYFPSISGNNVVWVLTAEGCDCIFSYFTRTDKFSEGLTEKSMKKICQNSNKVHLKYYTSPEKWKEKIQEMYQGDMYSIYKDGWSEELKYCDYVASLGREEQT